jgi:hypothetical protein
MPTQLGVAPPLQQHAPALVVSRPSHPADEDGPTIQADPDEPETMIGEGVRAGGTERPGVRPAAGMTPNLPQLGPGDDDDEDGHTIVEVSSYADAQGGPAEPAAPAAGLRVGYPDPFSDPYSSRAPMSGAPSAPPLMAPAPHASGRAAPEAYAKTQGLGSFGPFEPEPATLAAAGAAAPSPAQVTLGLNNPGFAGLGGGGIGAAIQASLAEGTGGAPYGNEGAPWMGPSQMPQASMPANVLGGGSGLGPTAPPPAMAQDAHARARMLPTVPRLGRDAPTVTAQAVKQRKTTFFLAIGGAVFFGLVLVGVIIAVAVSSSSGGNAAPKVPGSASVASGAGTALPGTGGAGPFASTRGALREALAPPSAEPPPLQLPPQTPPPALDMTGTPDVPPSPSTPDTTSGAGTSPSAPPSAQVTPTAQAPQPVTPTPQPVTPTPQPVTPTPTSKATASSTPAGTATLSIVCLPACSQIFDNGSPVGPSPSFGRTVPSGSHVIRGVNGKNSRTETVRLKPGESQTLRLSVPD